MKCLHTRKERAAYWSIVSLRNDDDNGYEVVIQTRKFELLFHVVQHLKCVVNVGELNWYDRARSVGRELKIHGHTPKSSPEPEIWSFISRRYLGYDGKEMYQNVKRPCRACRAIVFAH